MKSKNKFIFSVITLIIILSASVFVFIPKSGFNIDNSHKLNKQNIETTIKNDNMVYILYNKNCSTCKKQINPIRKSMKKLEKTSEAKVRYVDSTHGIPNWFKKQFEANAFEGLQTPIIIYVKDGKIDKKYLYMYYTARLHNQKAIDEAISYIKSSIKF